ncbi:hypothetical protein ACX43S_19380 [Enterobacter cloacae]
MADPRAFISFDFDHNETEKNLFVGQYVGGADSSSNLPDGLQRNRTISWDWANIASAVDQMMGEGKNKE